MYSDDGGNCFHNSLGEWCHLNSERPEDIYRTPEPPYESPAKKIGSYEKGDIYVVPANQEVVAYGTPEGTVFVKE